MRYLYVLLLLSLAALLWAAWAISRHIRKHSGHTGEDHHVFELPGEDRRGALPIPVKNQVQPGKSFEK
jgi:hypothetical protein